MKMKIKYCKTKDCNQEIYPHWLGKFCNNCKEKFNKKIQDYYLKKKALERDYYSICRI